MIYQTFPIAEKLIANCLGVTRQLQTLLIEEAELLKISNQATQLNRIVEQKKPLINQINQFTRQIAQVLASEVLPNNQNGMLQYLAKAKATGLAAEQMQQLWSDMLTTSEACRLLNEQNGASIDILSRHTQRSLHILKGNTQTPNTYGKDGSTSSEFNSRQLISV